ncbi:YybH family protein [Pseudomonas plecoglossicida]|uniref:YybH family protein n=1 Tax=Pseudomonas plecoglossicida TaxID=70775 RepID=UPI0015E3B741|nr:nuclear transport factor 2 family protein [Pseudomonas plecoglossicida]MBA1324677.1 nuclear transport factor 2 family protein [Pseudomonas plecoglossicida]
MDQTLQVSQAAAELVDAFASNDTERYFACFSEDATFVFHTLPQPLLSRQAYKALWQQWQEEGFKVLDCQSSNATISLQGDLAIFIHDVATRISVNGEEQQLAERETILFRRHNSRWLACHEHLSVVSPA